MLKFLKLTLIVLITATASIAVVGTVVWSIADESDREGFVAAAEKLSAFTSEFGGECTELLRSCNETFAIRFVCDRPHHGSYHGNRSSRRDKHDKCQLQEFEHESGLQRILKEIVTSDFESMPLIRK